MNKKIPAWAYIESQILHLANLPGLLKPAVRSIEAQYNMPPGSFGNGIFLETRILSMLYLLIVVPKEFWGLSNDHPIYDQIEKAWSLNDVNVITDKSPWQKPIYKFIHHLRNAMAHANFEFMDENFVF
jgi:hypothetical protein